MGDAHPDRQGHLDAAGQQAAADRASDITDAYTVLRAPHQRAVHLLELLGTPLNEETGGSVLGPDFLMAIMEVREALEAAGTDPPRLHALRSDNQLAVDALLKDLAAAFGSQDLAEARKLTARLQYLQRIEEEIAARVPVE